MPIALNICNKKTLLSPCSPKTTFPLNSNVAGNDVDVKQDNSALSVRFSSAESAILQYPVVLPKDVALAAPDLRTVRAAFLISVNRNCISITK